MVNSVDIITLTQIIDEMSSEQSTLSLSNVINHCGCSYHKYTDDTQRFKNMQLCIWSIKN